MNNSFIYWKIRKKLEMNFGKYEIFRKDIMICNILLLKL